MTAQKNVNGVLIDLTQADIDQAAVDAVAWASGATRRALAAIDQTCGMTRDYRDLYIASTLSNTHPKKAAAIAAETQAVPLRSQL